MTSIDGSKATASYAVTHCRNCKAGWTRTGERGFLTVCLLDREKVMPGMTHCDRFQLRDENDQA